jgi:nicotinate (nicotinamide) nucleotide adenylyltransferase
MAAASRARVSDEALARCAQVPVLGSAGTGCPRAVSLAADKVRPRRVGFFGASLNPPTWGHVMIVKHFAAELDEVWVAPVYQHIYESKSHLAAFRDRCDMARASFAANHMGGRSNIRVVEVEREAFEAQAAGTGAGTTVTRVGTVDVLAFLRARHPDVQFVLILGADTFLDLAAVPSKWKRGEELLATTPVAVFSRLGSTALPSELPRGVELHAVPGLGFHSSTLAREACLKDINQLRDHVVDEVAEIIEARSLYMPADTPRHH